MEFKKLIVGDEAKILRLNETLRSGFIEESAIKKFLANPNNYFFVAIDEEIVGFTYGYKLDRLDRSEKMLYIHEVGVLEEYWNRGIGTELLNALREHCMDNDIGKLFLFANSENRAAMKLYEKQNAEKADADSVFFINI